MFNSQRHAMLLGRSLGKSSMLEAMVKHAAARDAEAVKENQAMVKAAINYHALKEAERLISDQVQTHQKFSAAKAVLDQRYLRGMSKRADIDMAREVQEMSQAEADLKANGWLWNTLNEHPVQSTMAGLGALLGANGLANMEYARALGDNAANLTQRMGHFFAGPTAPLTMAGLAHARGQQGATFMRSINPFISRDALGIIGEAAEAAHRGVQQQGNWNALARAMESADAAIATQRLPVPAHFDAVAQRIFTHNPNVINISKAADEAVGKAQSAFTAAKALRGSRIAAAAGILGAAGLGYWDWGRGRDSILRDYFGQKKTEVSLPADRSSQYPYVNPYQAAAIGAGLGMGGVALGKALVEGDLPNLPSVALGALTGAGLGAVGANVYNTMTTDYAANPLIGNRQILKV